ncbi:MAG: hypothetical protein RLZZ524_1806, partial [Pseudomonadota bacterium]
MKKLITILALGLAALSFGGAV